ncbi:hypothetical protein CK203_116778 [Vitis vinifera]|uniref:Uncharacterized protein n=1 Tax=Vitis vinifera TaxID=29760 RepID=A0A438CMW8_VITVI|nr:hypothetical protein CK203_116778 [Vitis vinifera]
MCRGDDHLAWKRPISLEACKRLRTARCHILIHFFAFSRSDLRSQSGYASLGQSKREEALAGLRQEIGNQQSRLPIVQDETLHDLLPQPPPIPTSYILRGVRVMRQPPPAAARPVEGTSAPEESLLASSSTHCDALIRALSQIRVETTTSLEGLIHMMTAGRATCIVFSDDDLPPEGSNHTRPLYISVDCSGRQVPSVLLDNGSTLNVCPLATAIALGYAPSDFGPST